MAYDFAEWDDRPVCPSCRLPILERDTRTTLHHPDGTSSLWHAECARPHWDRLTSLLQRLARGWGK